MQCVCVCVRKGPKIFPDLAYRSTDRMKVKHVPSWNGFRVSCLLLLATPPRNATFCRLVGLRCSLPRAAVMESNRRGGIGNHHRTLEQFAAQFASAATVALVRMRAPVNMMQPLLCTECTRQCSHIPPSVSECEWNL